MGWLQCCQRDGDFIVGNRNQSEITAPVPTIYIPASLYSTVHINLLSMRNNAWVRLLSEAIRQKTLIILKRDNIKFKTVIHIPENTSAVVRYYFANRVGKRT